MTSLRTRAARWLRDVLWRIERARKRPLYADSETVRVLGTSDAVLGMWANEHCGELATVLASGQTTMGGFLYHVRFEVNGCEGWVHEEHLMAVVAKREGAVA